jgi:hypothetical protein
MFKYYLDEPWIQGFKSLMLNPVGSKKYKYIYSKIKFENESCKLLSAFVCN